MREDLQGRSHTRRRSTAAADRFWGKTVALIGLAFAFPGSLAAQAPVIKSPADLSTAVSAQVACGSIFVTGRSEADVLRDDIHVLAPIAKTVKLSVDRWARTVTASAPGGTSRTAYFRPAVGCTLMTGTVTREALDRQVGRLKPFAATPRDRWPRRPIPAGIDKTALDTAVRAAFDEQNKDGHPDTRAIVVVRDGAIVAERYAPGFDGNSRLLGWSATKSIMGTLVGLLVDDGMLTLDAPAPVPQWQGVDDPRRVITLRQLLNMSSGLSFVETYKPGSDSIRMLFASADMAADAAGLPLKNPPGTVFDYSSGTSNILSAIVFRTTGGTLEGVTRFATDRLFKPAGMTSVLIAPDESGVPVGSSYGYATARDWARYGLLHLNGGKAGNRQLLSKGWLDFALSPTAAVSRRPYGGQIWLNCVGQNGRQRFSSLPTDMFMAMGHNQQMVAIIPSRNTVIVRLGWTPDDRDFDYNKYLASIIAALAPAKSSMK